MTKQASAQEVEKRPNDDLVGTLHRFGDIGPVYEVISVEDEGFVTICLVESGDTARYPIQEVRVDPLA
jgi:hypothetical protein